MIYIYTNILKLQLKSIKPVVHLSMSGRQWVPRGGDLVSLYAGEAACR